MLRIGDFARLGGVTVRALRHYEAKGLLAPAQVDPATGYRSYRFDQLAALDRVLALRDLGFPLADVRALLASATDTAALVRRLGEQRARLAAELETQTARLRRPEALQAAIAGDPGAAGLSVRVRRIPDVRVLALRSRVRSEGAPMAALFEEAEARASRHRVDSSPFLIFTPRGVNRLIQDVVRKSGGLVFRVDKPGAGDSEGDCAKTDLATELEGYRRAFAAFRKHPRVDPARVVLLGISNGGGFAPLVAGDAPVAAYVSVGGWSKTWFEHMIDLERRRIVLSGTEPAKVAALLKPLAELHAAYLFDRLTPAQVAERRPHLKGIWYEEPDSQYGRPARFYTQLQELDLAAAWGKVRAPTLVVWGDYDWIMDREGQEQIVRLVGPAARLLVVPRADHGLTQHPDEKTAFRNMGRGEYAASAAEEILAFIRAR